MAALALALLVDYMEPRNYMIGGLPLAKKRKHANVGSSTITGRFS
jgi:hypothetical protein